MPKLLSSEYKGLSDVIEFTTEQLYTVSISGGSKKIALCPIGGCIELVGITVVEVPDITDCQIAINDSASNELVGFGFANDSTIGQSAFNSGTVFSSDILPLQSEGDITINVSGFVGSNLKTGKVIVTLRIIDPLSFINN